MKKTTCKTILLFLIYALALNPISAVLANQTGGLLSNLTTTHCEMNDKAQNSAMTMDEALPSMSMTEKAGCNCKVDCHKGACEKQCADCGHFFAGFPALNTELIHNHSGRIKVTSDIRHQLSRLMHYRPPIYLHS